MTSSMVVFLVEADTGESEGVRQYDNERDEYNTAVVRFGIP